VIFTDKSFCLEVWGDYACFARPEMKGERVRYDVITPSAARAIFTAIFWKPAIRWHVRKIEVLNPIQWTSVRRNEVGAGKGQCFNQPYFGCREFSCAFRLVVWIPLNLSAHSGGTGAVVPGHLSGVGAKRRVVQGIVSVLIDRADPLQYVKRSRARNLEPSKGWVQIVSTLFIETPGGH